MLEAPSSATRGTTSLLQPEADSFSMVRKESLKDDRSLHDNSDAEKEIILRVMSRFFRSSVQSGSGDEATSQ